MKFICLKENLREGLSIAERIIDKNSSLPILEHLLLKTEKGQLVITATNLEIGIQHRISGKIEEEGVITSPARTFSQFINLSLQEKITLESTSYNLTIRDKKTETTLKSLDPEEYPIFPSFTPEESFVVKNKDLTEALESVIIALAGSELRPELAGVFISLKDSGVICAATDSFRLAEKKIPQGKSQQKEASFIVPSRTIQEVIRIGRIKPHEEVEILFNKNQITFNFPSTILTSRLISGSFPDYQQIIPQNPKTELLVAKKDFLHILQLASIVAGKLREVHFLYDGGDALTLKSRNPELGEHRSHLEIKKKGGEGIALNFNVNYLLDVLPLLRGDEVKLAFHGEARPGMFTSPLDPNYLYIVMPLKT